MRGKAANLACAHSGVESQHDDGIEAPQMALRDCVEQTLSLLSSKGRSRRRAFLQEVQVSGDRLLQRRSQRMLFCTIIANAEATK